MDVSFYEVFYKDVDICDEYEVGFFSMCGYERTSSNENADDTHELKYIQIRRNEMDEHMVYSNVVKLEVLSNCDVKYG